MYVNKYTVACNARNSVAYNTTRRRLFCFHVLIKVFLLVNNIQKVDTFHRRNLTAHVGQADSAGTACIILWDNWGCWIVKIYLR